ncbi:MAG: TPMT family class I SAM-dependent methyltransferase [Betaproteobacteria bacterium]|nr:TPMT family class I SAM-dependent methyltransferase [Betaproteobacteria bacterium]
MAGPDKDFWEERFSTGNTPWDRGASSPQLGAWLASGALQPCRILVPGCGSGYEVAELAMAKFEVTGLDYADEAIARTHRRISEAEVDAAIVRADVLAWEPDRPFDAIYEQTCLCALYPDQWREYADRLYQWLRPGGRLFALFLQLPRAEAAQGFIQGPPYHCDINGMRALFPESRWDWPKPPYARTTHPAGIAELAVVLKRTG